MNIQEILKENTSNMVDELCSQRTDRPIKDYLAQFNPKGHLVNDERHRPKKQVQKDGRVILQEVTRLALPFQKIIVNRATTFLVGEKINIVDDAETDNEKLVAEMIRQMWHDAKMDYRTRQMVRKLFSETEVAELWYFYDSKGLWNKLLPKKNVKYKMRSHTFAHSLNDTLYPHFDEFGDMDAFSRKYTLDSVEMLDVYTADRIMSLNKKAGVWQIIKDKANELGKIPVVYYTQDQPEWSDVQSLIDRFETMLSNYSDTNDYFSSPLVVLKGDVTGFADKGETGKMISLEQEADVKYLTWDQAPEAIRLEKDTLQELIFSMTQTPDISFEKIKGTGNLTGVALRLMFLDAQMKALKHQEEVGEGIQRRLNILKAAVGIIYPPLKEIADNMNVWAEFNFYMPGNDAELVQLLSIASGGKAILSRESALKYNPFVTDVEYEKDMIEEDEQRSGESLIYS